MTARGLWWHRGSAAAVLAVATLTTAAAAVGPLYARAADESILQDHLRQAASQTGLHLTASVYFGEAGDYRRAARSVPRPGSIRGYDRMVPGLTTDPPFYALAAGAQAVVHAPLVWRQGACRHLVLVAGRCPAGPTEAMVSQRTAGSPLYGIRLGSDVDLYQGGSSFASMDNPVAAVTVVGVYRPIDPRAAYWLGQPFFHATPGDASGDDTIDAVFTTRDTFASYLSAAVPGAVQASFDYPLTTSALRVADVASERRAVTDLLSAHRAGAPVSASTGLLSVLDAAARDQHLASIGALLVVIQLALLGLLVLFQVMSEAIEARGDEIAIAKLRGYSPAATVAFALGEPLVLLAAAVPVGLALAVLVTHLFAAAVLVPGVPVVVTWGSLLAAVVAFGGGLLAAGLGGYRTLTRTVLDQWRHTTRRLAYGRLAFVADVVLGAAATAGLVLLLLTDKHAAGSGSGTSALLAPGLLVCAVALVGVRLVPVGCRWLARRTRASRWIGVFLAVRQVARQPAGLRLAALLAVAVGLATFAVAGESVAAANRGARARAELGAQRVVSVYVAPGIDPITATQRADPTGRWAMTAATWWPDASNAITGPVLGVDSTRLAAVGYTAAGGPPVSQIADAIRASVPELSITSRKVRVRLIATDLSGDQAPRVQVNLRTALAPYVNAEGPPLRDGRHAYVMTVPCAQGCGLRGLTWDRPITAHHRLSGTITVIGVDVPTPAGAWAPLNLHLHRPAAWRAAKPQGNATDQVTVTRTGIVDRFSNADGGYGGIGYAQPARIPAVATHAAVAARPPAQPPDVVDALTATTADLRLNRLTRVLPAVLSDGVIADLRTLTNELPGFLAEAHWQVWLGSQAPGDALDRLRAAGLRIGGVRTVPARLRQLARQGPALALLLLLACAVGGAVLALGGTAASIRASGRRRSYQIAALRTLGVRPRSLLGANVGEQLLLLGAAVLLGVPTGISAARLAMPVIPEFAQPTPVTLNYVPAWAPPLLFAGGFVALLTVAALLAGRTLIRTSPPARLRESDA